ncbi:site-specific integrase [Burkholderia sp. S171]|uniref:tyrosine-type recombinase/integrase n=1 Tax=Burkholderia sp. S171 TaxID=1641860 RepID=UPI00131D4F33|nr:site-specific integrase [Burkholderia sp. S171]
MAKNLTVKADESLGDEKLSAMTFAKAKAKDKPYQITAGRGLRMRVAIDCTKTWLVRYHVDGKELQYRIPEPYGSGPDFCSWKDALVHAANIQALARQGVDYAKTLIDDKEAENRAREEQRNAEKTVQNLFDVWHAEISVKRGKKGRKDGGAEAKRMLEKDVLPFLGNTLLTKITKNDVLNVVRRVSNREANRLAVMIVRDLKQMFRYGESNQPWKRLLVESDVLAIQDTDVVRGAYDPVSDNERTRVLSVDEIKALKEKMSKSGLTAVVQSAVWVMLGCGTRVGETVAAEWGHIDLQARTWSIPKENTKTQTAITIYLSDFVLRQFQALWDKRQKLDADKRSAWVFPSRTDRLKPLNNQTVGKALADRQRDNGNPIAGRTEQVDALMLPGGEWRCHDLRRTAGTLMQVLHIPEGVAHRCLNHAQADKLSRIYLQYDYADEMRAAWTALGNYLDEILAAQVLPFPHAA